MRFYTCRIWNSITVNYMESTNLDNLKIESIKNNPVKTRITEFTNNKVSGMLVWTKENGWVELDKCNAV